MNSAFKFVLILLAVLFLSCSKKSPGESIVIQLVDKAHTLESDPGFFWDTPVYNKDKSICYVLKNEGHEQDGYSPHSLVKVTADSVTTVTDAEIVRDTSILGIKKVSDDGSRILVELHYVSEKDGFETSYKMRPAFVDVESKEIIEIDP